MKKGFKITIGVIVSVIVLGFALYKPAYNYIAPKIFDYVIEKNLNQILKSTSDSDEKEDSENKQTESTPNQNVTDNTEKQAEEYDSEEQKKREEVYEKQRKEAASKSQSKASANSELNENNEDGVYKSKTHIGVLTEKDIAEVSGSISAQDKTRIVSILRGCVAASDYPEIAKRMSGGMDNDDKAYLEGYVRSHLTPQQKKEILTIIAQYR